MDISRAKVLIVDDDALIAITTAQIFSADGYDVKAVYSAEGALELIRDWRPHAAIVDVLLPKMDGITLARLLQYLCPDCAVLIFSSQDLTSSSFHMVKNDPPFLSKPVHPDILLALVRDSLAGQKHLA